MTKPQQRPSGHNILEHICGGPVLHLPNFGCERLTGANRNNRTVLGFFAAYASRCMAALPHGSAILIPREDVPLVQRTLEALQTQGLAQAIAIIGVTGVYRESIAEAALRQADTIANDMAAAGCNAATLLPFIGSELANALAHRLGMTSMSDNIASVEAANHKGLSKKAMQVRGVPCPTGVWLRGTTPAHALAAYQSLASQHPGHSLFAKLSRAASGEGVCEVTNSFELQRFLNRPITKQQLRDPALGVVLDVEVPTPDGLPNLMLYIGASPEKDVLITASQQLLRRAHPSDRRATIYEGNISIAPGTPEWNAITADVPQYRAYLHSIGYTGFVGIDTALDLGNRRAHFLEFNARINGNNAASFTALGVGTAATWAAHNKFEVPSGATLEQIQTHLTSQGVGYNPRTGHGVFVLNAVTGARHGTIQIGVRAENRDHAKALLARAIWTT